MDLTIVFTVLPDANEADERFTALKARFQDLIQAGILNIEKLDITDEELAGITASAQ